MWTPQPGLLSRVVVSEPLPLDRYEFAATSLGTRWCRGAARFVEPDETVLLTAGGVDVVGPRIALGEGPLRHFGDLRRPLEQSQQIQPTGEPLAFVASFANEHALDPPVLG